MAHRAWLKGAFAAGSRVAAVGAAMAPALSLGQNSFRPLGVPPTATGSAGWLLSADGRTVAGTFLGSRIWWLKLGEIPAVMHEVFSLRPASVTGISADGAALVGRVGTVNSFKFSTVSGLGVLLPMISGQTFAPTAVAASGAIVIGAQNAIFPAILGEGVPEYLIPPITPDATFGMATAATADAGVVVGYFTSLNDQSQTAFRWTPAGGTLSLGYLDPPSTTTYSRARAVSPDGAFIVGVASQGVGARGFFWTAETGMISMGEPTNGDSITPNGVSNVGRIAVCDSYSGTTGQSSAVIWDSAHGFRDLRRVLLERGFSGPLEGWSLLTAKGISANGTTIVGTGIDELGRQQAYAAYLRPDVCYANCDGSTAAPVLNVSDFVCFLDKFAAGDSAANCDASTVQPILSAGDFICFLARYTAGCS